MAHSALSMETLISFQQFRSMGPIQLPQPIIILSKPSCSAKIPPQNTAGRYLPLSAKTKRLAVKRPRGGGGCGEDDYGIPANHVKTLAKFDSLHNHIRVLEVSRRADHQLAGSRLLLLDRPGNIHSISFLLQPLTFTYFDIFATLPPILPPNGPIAILGFGAGTAARLLLHLYPDLEIHGWELDQSVIAVAREFFGLDKLERQHRGNLHIHIGDALAEVEGEGIYAGILVDLFHKGSVVPELQDPETWKRLRRRLRRGGMVMANCGGKCVEAEDTRRDGETVMEETVRAMSAAGIGGADEVFVLMFGHGEGEGCVAMTGPWSKEVEAWKCALPKPLKGYVDRWKPFNDNKVARK